MTVEHQQAAYLLHYKPFRDTSIIADVLTLHRGRLSLIARGARSSRSKTRALYQPFRPLLVSWTGEHELKTLVGIEESGPAHQFDNASLACAYYLNELLLRLLGKEHPAPELFAHYALALAQLDSPDNAETTLRTFELQLLEALGVLPNFANCTPSNQPIQAEYRYRFFPSRAVAIVDKLSQSAADARVAEPAPNDLGWHADGVTPDEGVDISGQSLLALAALNLSEADVRREVKPLMRKLLRVHLGDRPLQSRELFATLAPSVETADVEQPAQLVDEEPMKNGEG